jgi:hydrogenase maturation protease
MEAAWGTNAVNEWEWHLLEDRPSLEQVEIAGTPVRRGDRVWLRPRVGGDVFDLALAGKSATVESLEQDYEGNVHVCVVVDDDPGRDVGLLRQPGHRFFFTADELEPLPPGPGEQSAEKEARKILVAGIGNIFLGDDGFGVQTAQQLLHRAFPSGVRVVDFGIRGFDLAYALLDGYETTILVDACLGEGAPGTLTVMEPELADLVDEKHSGAWEPHVMNPSSVLRMAAGMGAELKRVLLVGCVPKTFGPEEGQMGLSQPVAAAVGEAVDLIESLVGRILGGGWPGRTRENGELERRQ